MSVYNDGQNRSYSLVVANANESAYKQIEYGIATEAGVKLDRFGINLIYSHGLSNINKRPFIVQKNRLISIGLNYYL